MNPNAEEVAAALAVEAGRELTEALDRIEHCLRQLEHCLRQLTDEQVWWRPSPEMNSCGCTLFNPGAGETRRSRW
jgi:hypothetical protein